MGLCFSSLVAVIAACGGSSSSPNVDSAPGVDAPYSPWSALAGTPLAGDWSLRVLDNGFVFAWSIELDPALMSGCAP